MNPEPSTILRTGQVSVVSVATSTIGVTGYAPEPDTSACLYDSGAPYFVERDGRRPLLVSVESDGPPGEATGTGHPSFIQHSPPHTPRLPGIPSVSSVATIVHAADLHIDSLELPLASRRRVRRLVDLALTERADLLVISGDVFDRASDSAAAGRFFAGELGRLGEVGVPVLVAAGNHDVVCPRATASAGNVWWFPTGAPASVVLDGIGVVVHGQGLADPVEPRDLSAGFPAPRPGYLNLGVLHTSLDGAMSRTICAPTSVARLAGVGYDYWALGHVHQRRVAAIDPWVVYPGRDGATVVTTVAGAVATVEHRDLATLVPA